MIMNGRMSSQRGTGATSRQILSGVAMQSGYARGQCRSISIGEGMRQCQDCSATFSASDVHSCVYYLQRLLRTIVGDTAFERAQANVD